MKRWFTHPAGAGPVPPDDQLPGLSRRLTVADRACCCPARPAFTVVIPAGHGRPHPVDLQLCGHHYRASVATLRAAGADVYDEAGALIMSGQAGQHLPAASVPPQSQGRAVARLHS
jgi:hypothetical protein